MAACVALACATASGPGPDLAAGPETWANPLAELTRIVGRENVERGDELLALFQERGLAPQVQEFRTEATEGRPSQVGRNLIATIGDGPRDIVVGAHYDVVRLPDGTVVGGAVDNGAASVVLTRVAETLGRHELEHRVRVVLFDLEESGLLGSRAYVEDAEPDRIAAMVNVDVVVGDTTLMYGPTSHRGKRGGPPQPARRLRRKRDHVHGFPPLSPERRSQLSGRRIPSVSLAMNDAAASHQMWLALNAGAESGLRENFVPEVFRIIHSSRDTIEHVSEAAMNHLHDLVVALVLELDGSL